MTQSMHIGRAWLDRIREVSWPLVYGFNILVCIGQIIASEIANRYGANIFGASAGAAPQEEEQPINFVERDHAIARTGVVSSIGIAIGTVNLILTLGSFIVYKFLDYRRTRVDTRKDYDQRFIVVIVVSVLNFILFAGNIGLTVGFALTSHTVAQHTINQQTATPEYLIAAAVMAALSAVLLLATIIVDQRKLAKQRRKIGMDEQERIVAEPEEERVASPEK